MKTYKKLAIILSLGLSLMGCGGVGTEEDPALLPVAKNDTATVTENGAAIGILVLDNDTPSAKLDVSSVGIITPPQHGSADVTNTGEVKYLPSANYSGADSLVYTVKDTDGNFSNPATVSITITQQPFKITVKTNNAGLSADNEFTIPIIGSGSYNIDCSNSGAVSGTTLSGTTCIYPSAGIYTISITGDIPHVSFSNNATGVSDNLKLLSIDQWGSGQWSSMKSAFSNCINMELNASDIPNLTSVKDMSRMFIGVKSFNGNIALWNVSNIEDMSYMFAATPTFNQNIGDWDVSSVTDMKGMFFQAIKFNGDIGTWREKVSNVRDMNDMFYKAENFNRDIGTWDVSSVKNMSNMFSRAKSFEGINIGTWGEGVSKVDNMRSMFSNAEIFNANIGDWNVSSVTHMGGMFSNAKNFEGINIGKWGGDVSKVVRMGGMFDGAEKFNGNIGNWDISSVSSMNAMFRDATNFEGTNIGDWGDKVKNTTFMISMFQGAKKFDQNIGSWDVGKVSYMQDMFKGVTLSPDIYDSILIGWEQKSLDAKANGTIWYKRFFNGGNSIPAGINGINARQLLEDREFWGITDGDG